MRISIALCAYNGERYLQDQLESFVTQTRPPDELIICDDCSTDKTVEIIRLFAETAPFPVRCFINDSNLGYIKNFERAISLCTGDIIFLSDQDDVWHKEKIEKFYAEFASDEKVGLVFCDGELVSESLESLDGNAWQICRFNKAKQKKMANGGGLAILLTGNVVSGCMAAFRAKFKDLLLPIPTNLHFIHDYWIALLISTVAKIKPLPERLVKYRQHNQQQLGLSSEKGKTFWEKVAERQDLQEQNRNLENLKIKLKEHFSDNSENYQIDRRIVIDEINSYLRHIETRLRISDSGWLRLPLIFRELIFLRYHRYSKGWRSSAKDFFLFFLGSNI